MQPCAVAYPARLKRVWLHSIYRRSQQKGTTLYDEIMGVVDSAASIATSGSVPQSVNVGSTSITNFSPERGGISPADAATIVDEMLTIYADARAILVAAGDATPTDSEIYTEMLNHDNLNPVKVFFPDFSGLTYEHP